MVFKSSVGEGQEPTSIGDKDEIVVVRWVSFEDLTDYGINPKIIELIKG